jgi:hypothetical protein
MEGVGLQIDTTASTQHQAFCTDAAPFVAQLPFGAGFSARPAMAGIEKEIGASAKADGGGGGRAKALDTKAFDADLSIGAGHSTGSAVFALIA